MAERKDIDQLIGAYLDGELGEADRQWLEAEMQRDSELAKLVADLRREQRIEDFLAGKLSEAGEAAFRRELEQDEALKNAWEAYHLVRGAVRLKQRAVYRDLLEEIDREKQGPPPAGRGRWWWLSILAGVLIAVAGYFYLSEPPPVDQQDPAPVITDPESAPGGVPAPGPQEDQIDQREPDATPSTSPAPRANREQTGDEAALRAQLATLSTVRFPFGDFSQMGGGLPAIINEAYRAYEAGADSSVVALLTPRADSLIARQDLRTIVLLAAALIDQGRYPRALSLLDDSRLNFAISELSGQANWYRLLALLHLERYAEAARLIDQSADELDTPYRTWMQELQSLIPRE